MVIDDNPYTLELFRVILAEITNVPVEFYHSPETALAAFTSAPETFALVIMDFEMPGMNGAELCRRMHEKSPALKALLVTGNSTGCGITSFRAVAHMGFCGLIRKPFQLNDLKYALMTTGVTGDTCSNGSAAFMPA